MEICFVSWFVIYFFQISLLQKDNRLLHILLILFSSFLIVLFLVAVAWKAKITYDAYQLRNNQAVERREMAARPFAGINLSCDDIYSSVKVSVGRNKSFHRSLTFKAHSSVCASNYGVSAVDLILSSPTGVCFSSSRNKHCRAAIAQWQSVRLSIWKVGCSIHDHWVKSRCAPSAVCRRITPHATCACPRKLLRPRNFGRLRSPFVQMLLRQQQGPTSSQRNRIETTCLVCGWTCFL